MLIPNLEPITVFLLSELNYIVLTVPHLIFYHPGIQYCYSQFTTSVSATSFTTSPSSPFHTISKHTKQNRPCHLLSARLLAPLCHRGTCRFLPGSPELARAFQMCLTSAELKSIIISLNLPATFPLPQPRRLLAFFCHKGAFAGSCSTCCPV